MFGDPSCCWKRRECCINLSTASTPPEGDLSAFSDGDTVGSYAKDAVGWAVSNGLIGGMEDGTIAPKATATRAQAATVLMRYSEAFK